MPNLLIEIGVEELPLGALDIIYSELAPKITSVLQENRLAHGALTVEATPRRIAVFVPDLAARQQDQNLEIKGPSLDKAYDAQGKPTPALEGFLRSKGAQVSDLVTKDSPKGKVVVLERMEKGRSASAVLPVLFADIFAALGFPKRMRWEASGYAFPRPVRWIIALLDKKVLPLQLGDIKASNQSRGHRFLSPKPFAVKSADWKIYTTLLKKAHVLLSLGAREEAIRSALKTRFGQKDFDEELVHMAAQLVEEPFMLDGAFDKDYLRLPPEVLETCMKKNQKIFAVRGPKGTLENRFVAVMNGRRSGLARIRFDYENVLESRLHDARYFFHADTKEPLASKLPQLAQIVYLGKLGSMRDKSERFEKLAGLLADETSNSPLKQDLMRAASLAKADLMTHLVFEFPNLQGLVGREYAIASGEKKEVARAIGTQYLPKNLSQSYREVVREMDLLGALLGIADRLDLLVGAFATGLEPTGSQDPYALRRAAGSIVKMVRAFEIRFQLTKVIDSASHLYRAVGLTFEKPQPTAAEVTAKLKAFLKDRMIFELQLKPGTRAQEIFEAVWRSNSDDLADVFDRFEALNRLSEESAEDFLKAGKVVERTSNIVKGSPASAAAIDPEFFQEPVEKKLYELLQNNAQDIAKRVSDRKFEEATRLFGQVFYGPVHDFFDQVMVNVEDAKIKTNRQSLMKQINRLYTEHLADLSVISRLDQQLSATPT